MTIYEYAEALKWREMGNELTEEEEQKAKAIDEYHQHMKSEYAREIFEAIETSLYYKMVSGEVTLMIREVDYHELKNKYVEAQI